MELLAQWPQWLGTPSQVALLVIVIVTLIKTWPLIQRQVFDARHAREGRYGERIRELEKELTKCHEDCTAKVDKLTREVEGMRIQRVAEQIALMRAILRTVESPELRQQLSLLEAMQMAMPPAFVGGPVEDGDHNEGP